MIIPHNNNPKVRAGSIILEHEGKFLFLKRAPTKKIEPNKWSIPGGSLNDAESPKDAAIRELFEETGIKITDAQFVDCFFCDLGHGPLEFSFFYAQAYEPQIIKLNSESSDFAWLTIKEARKKELVTDENETLNRFENWYKEHKKLQKHID